MSAQASTSEKSILNHDDEERQQMLDVNEKPAEGAVLPSPVSAVAPKPAGKPKLSTTVIIPIWIVLSSSVIIYNNYLYNTLSFRFPVFLVTWHLTFAVSSVTDLACFVFRAFSTCSSIKMGVPGSFASCNLGRYGRLVSNMY